MKTLFFPLSSKDVYRNLFFFPGSVFERLKEFLKSNTAVRVVFIIPSKDYDKFAPMIAPSLCTNCVIETADFPQPENTFQKLFHFFYSYLIYTDTTRMLATMGMRPDEPPAGGKRWLAPIKWCIANTFGRFSYIKRCLVPRWYHFFYSARSVSHLFERYRPDLVFLPTLFRRFDMNILAEAKRRGIQTMGMISAWDHFDKYFLPFHVDHLLAQSDEIRRFAIEYQAYYPEEISVVGYPHCDFITNEAYAWPRERVLRKLGFSEDTKYLLYVSGSVYFPDEPDIIEQILRWIDEGKFSGDIRLVIRPYQSGRGADREFDAKKYDDFAKHPKVVFYRREFWGNLDESIFFVNIMRHADVALLSYTTMVLELAALDRPLMTVTFDGNSVRPLARSVRRFALREHFQDVFRTGALKSAENFDQLFRYLDAYFRNSKLDGEKREILRHQLLFPLDGKTSERITRHILRALT